MSLFIGCLSEHSYKIGNGYCEDETNNEGCSYDGGDCCGTNVNSDFCTDCTCLEDLNCETHLDLIGNGFCNDESNIADCNFDGGDCCGSCAITNYCSECLCHAGSPINLGCK